MEIIRANTLAERAGAYYVRIQAMARKHRIPLNLEFDEHDNEATKYVLVVDDFLPVATCRMYPLDSEKVMLGRVVVLPEYRHKGIGTMVVKEAETWAKELGFTVACVESRDNKVQFYEGMGYVSQKDSIINGEVFDCLRMEKALF